MEGGFSVTNNFSYNFGSLYALLVLMILKHDVVHLFFAKWYG